MKYRSALRPLTPALVGAAAALLASCTSTPLPPDPAPRSAALPPPSAQVPLPQVAQPTSPPMVIKTSMATNPRAYRADAAQHIYNQNSDRIWKGRMPLRGQWASLGTRQSARYCGSAPVTLGSPQGRLRSSDARDGYAEGGAGDVVQP